MGDDDGFLAVVIANRLPVPGAPPDGERGRPMKYHAALVSLEGRLSRCSRRPPPLGARHRPPGARRGGHRYTPGGAYDHVAWASATTGTRCNAHSSGAIGPHAEAAGGPTPPARRRRSG